MKSRPRQAPGSVQPAPISRRRPPLRPSAPPQRRGAAVLAVGPL